MSKLPYTFDKIVTQDQAEFIIDMFNQHPINCRGELEVYAQICEILYIRGFRAYLDGMHNRKTNCHYHWELIMAYKTVTDFQIDCLMRNSSTDVD